MTWLFDDFNSVDRVVVLTVDILQNIIHALCNASKNTVKPDVFG